ncbi:hypothetical protein [Coprothermobacter platensis]|uniref:hypothetical protein n=1 Tax=Coprothermobacter platensis TaxID=108819 RepID=UPI000364ECB6|nr:hypothetical protein [Coprothermobacter platensis]
MKSGRVIGCFLLILLLAIGCTGTTSQNAVPLIFQYDDGNQISYVNALWSPEKGTMEIGKEPILSYSASLPIIAVHWESSGKASLFTSEDISTTTQVQANGVDINVISLANSLPSYYEPVVAYTTTQAIYASAGGDLSTTISKITASAMQQYQMDNGRFLGTGVMDEAAYVLVGKQNQYKVPETATSAHLATMSVILNIINPDGNITTKTVTDNYDASMLVLPNLNIPFAAGNFYFGGFRVDVTAQEPKLIQTTSITKGFEIISTATNLQPFEFYEESTFPTYTKYGDYLVCIGQTIGPTELTIAAFKNNELAVFSLITPYTMLRPIPESVQNTTIYTYDSNAKQLKAYSMKTPLKVFVPDSP